MKILDACCGSRMFWFDRANENVTFMDNRELETELCDGRQLVVKPDIVADFRDMPFEDNSFHLVVFDPPHLVKVEVIYDFDNSGFAYFKSNRDVQNSAFVEASEVKYLEREAELLAREIARKKEVEGE